MKILYIDTSCSYLYSAICDDDNVLVEIKEELGQDLSKLALPKIVDMFEKIKTVPKDINKIIVVNGPGSFTGIRIGITIAKVFAWSLNIPITTITSLESMCLSSNKKSYHVPVIDARRNYVYAAIYDDKNQQILKPQHIKIDDLEQKLKNIKADYTLITNDKVEINGVKENYNPNISKIVSYYKDKDNINPHMVNPDYLKLTEAEESKK